MKHTNGTVSVRLLKVSVYCICILCAASVFSLCGEVCVVYGVKWLPELVTSEGTTLYRYTGAVQCNSCVLHNYIHYICVCHTNVDRRTVQ